MRHLRLRQLAFLLIPAFVLSAAATEDSATTMYHDPALAFTYRYPAIFLPHAELAAVLKRSLAGDPNDPDRQKLGKCISVPLSGGQGLNGGAAEFDLLILMRVDHTCLGEPGSVETLGEAAQGLMKVLTPFGIPVTEDAVHFQLDGHEAYFVQGSAPAKALGEGSMLHAGSVCALVNKNTLCWLLVSSNHKAMPALMANPVTFDDHPAVPLVPKDIVQPW